MALASEDPTAVLRPLAPGLYTLPVWTDDARRALLAELEALESEAALGRRELPQLHPHDRRPLPRFVDGRAAG